MGCHFHDLSAAGSDASLQRWYPPERLSGQLSSTASDVYSFGVILWVLCSGEEPGAAGSPLRALKVPKEAPQEIVDLIAQCRQEEPGLRPTAMQVHAEIRRQTY